MIHCLFLLLLLLGSTSKQQQQNSIQMSLVTLKGHFCVRFRFTYQLVFVIWQYSSIRTIMLKILTSFVFQLSQWIGDICILVTTDQFVYPCTTWFPLCSVVSWVLPHNGYKTPTWFSKFYKRSNISFIQIKNKFLG